MSALSSPLFDAQDVPKFLLLGPQVLDISLRGSDLDGNALHDLQSVTFETDDLLGVVRHQAHLPHTDVAEDLRPDPIVPEVRLESQGLVRLHCILSLVLEGICLDLVGKADAPAFLSHIQDDPLALSPDYFYGLAELRPAVAPVRPEHVPCDALRMDTDQDLLPGGNLSLDKGQVLVGI